MDRCCEYVPVILVGKLQRWDKLFVAFNQAVHNRSIHQFARASELLSRKVRLVG
jgi:hypothetical protein